LADFTVTETNVDLGTGSGEPPVAKARRRALVSTAHIKTPSGEPAPASITNDTERFLSRDEVCQIVNLSYATVWDLLRRNGFPPARRISRNRVGWLQSEISQWMRTRPIQNYKPEAQMTERFYKSGTLPHLIPPGRVLAHNDAPHSIDTPHGVDGFKCFTLLKPDVPPNYQPCHCGWAAGLPHLAQPPSSITNRRTKT
jgi:prophage regulatory protein